MLDARDDAAERKEVLYLASDCVAATGVRWVDGKIKVNIPEGLILLPLVT